jgi:Ca2+-binding EF-hand superfamily protein
MVLTDAQQRFTEERICGMNASMIRHVFDDIDTDGSNTITIDELPLLAKQLGENWDAEQCKTIMDEIDVDNSGEVDFSEFYK